VVHGVTEQFDENLTPTQHCWDVGHESADLGAALHRFGAQLIDLDLGDLDSMPKLGVLGAELFDLVGGHRGKDTPGMRITALLVVPNGTHRPEPLAAAVRTHHASWEVVAVWCGDPQLRPRLDGVSWVAASCDEVSLVAGDVAIGEWKCAVTAARHLLAGNADRVVVLWVGACAVLGSLDELVRDEMTLVVRSVDALPDDGLLPTEADLAEHGLYSATVAAVGPNGRSALDWLAAHLDGRVAIGSLLGRVAQLFHVHECRDAALGVGSWRWASSEPALLDAPGYDADRPWTLDPELGGPERVSLIGHPERRALADRAAPQLTGKRMPLRLPGGMEVDDVVRRVVVDAEESPPSPWSDAAGFRHWLGPRYWPALHRDRRDLWAAYPDPCGRSAADFTSWCRQAFVYEDVPFLLRTAPPPSAISVGESLSDNGVNLVGYFAHQSGLADVVHRLADACELAGIDFTRVTTVRTGSPRRGDPAPGRVEFTTSLAVVTADQFAMLAGDFPELFAVTRRMIGYWFWELEHIPLAMRRAFALVDEIWAGSRFVTDAFAAVAPVPVRHVPIPVAEPTASGRQRGDFEPLADLGDRAVLLCTFDHLSVTERKNPVGVVEAFKRAFAPNEGPVLVIKTMNGTKRWSSHLRVLAAAEGRPDIRVWDETLDRADQMALVATAGCLVSLHRSEGLGLHLAEAMWLGTPVIATRYSGNLDFMNDDNSLLIDASMVNVSRGEGVYPPEAMWADPDLDLAAAAMRRIVSQPDLSVRLAKAGRATMESQPSLAETGRLIGHLLHGGE
jgi:glycosyltransferase involved in cell wall biosynthesis